MMWFLRLPDRTRAMPPVRTLRFFVPLVKALRPRTTPAKQLSTASSMKARVASQKATRSEPPSCGWKQVSNENIFCLENLGFPQRSLLWRLPTVMVCAWHLLLMQNLHSPWLAELPEYRYCIQKSVAVETMRRTRAATPHRVPPPAKVYSMVEKPRKTPFSWPVRSKDTVWRDF